MWRFTFVSFLTLLLVTGALPIFAAEGDTCSAEYATCDDMGDSGGSGGTGRQQPCLYCYTTNYAAYGNCFSSSWAMPYPMYSNCEGVRLCWSDGSGSTYCQPACDGMRCFQA